MVVRNEADLLATNVRYHSSIGVDSFLIVDDGSTDGTTDVLRRLSRRFHSLRWTRHEGRWDQSGIVTGLAREAHRAGFKWVVPTDADEFWFPLRGSLGEFLATCDNFAVKARVVNFVQDRNVINDNARAILSMTYRVSEPRGAGGDAFELVDTGLVAYVEMSHPPKCLTRTGTTVEISKGNHDVYGIPEPVVATDGLVCLHAPLRSRFRLEAKAEAASRLAPAEERPPGESWHIRRWSGLRSEGLLDEEWSRNSYGRRGLDFGHRHHVLVRDHRLRDALRPFVDEATVTAEPRWKMGLRLNCRGRLSSRVAR
jgi:hypothetical protein